MLIKKIAGLIVISTCVFSMLTVYASTENIVVPFIFDDEVVNTDGQFVTTVNDDNQGSVYSIDGKHIDTISNDGEILENSYIKVTPKGSGKWQVFTTQGIRSFEGAYDVVTVTEKDIAIVADGEWRPPGSFYGNYGAIDLKTGKTIVPTEFDELILSIDNRFIWGKKYTTSGIEYFAFDLNGQNVTNSAPFVCISQYPNGYYKVCSPKTGLWGVADKDQKLCTPISYDQLGDIVFEGAVLVCKNEKWGASSIDGSGKLLQPIEYSYGTSYENGMYTLIKGADMAENTYIAFYYGDGGGAFHNSDYYSVQACCGDIFYVDCKPDNSIAGISKTGQVVAGPFKNAYISFFSPECDFVLIGRKLDYGYGEAEGSMTVNRWGEIIAPYDTGNLLSDGALGRGLSLWNSSTDKTVRIMADGMHLTEMTSNPMVDYNRGWLIFNENNNSYITDIFGNVLISQGKYSKLYSNSYSYYYVNGQTITNSPKIFGTDINGKHGAFKIEDTPYIYQAHTWAQKDIEESVQKGLIPVSQQREWREVCTRADLCQLIIPLLDSYGITVNTSVSFSDTDDENILRLADLGIVSGTGDGKFSPNRPVTRQEAAVILSRCAKALSIDSTEKETFFADRDSFAPWAVEGISYINGIVCGGNDERVMQVVSSEKFSPLACYTREELMTAILRLNKAKESE